MDCCSDFETQNFSWALTSTKNKKLQVQIQTTLPVHAIFIVAPTSASSTRATQDVWNWHDGRGLLRWQERAAFVAQCAAYSQLHQGGAMCQRRRVLPDHGCLLSGNACSQCSVHAPAQRQHTVATMQRAALHVQVLLAGAVVCVTCSILTARPTLLALQDAETRRDANRGV